MKHVKPLEYQNRGAMVMENLQYIISLSATCPSGWWPRLSHNGATSIQGMWHTPLGEMMLQGCSKSSSSHKSRNKQLCLQKVHYQLAASFGKIQTSQKQNLRHQLSSP